ncbi:AraC family transcriptional regulator [Coprococcus sp. DFI.6.81]|uniref:helix-turn-helix transcriptional regulator n=1 Tax=Coprococcus sp. DFI.6.81 TaxID=2965278 RepID=UPI00082304AE|nr:AraC family transcriptional regulator [Coprococcus sp. DFI.6.81]MCQ5034367.1 AraC family transcriptional regulator [Coprococcus sp. DFI.6.81]SCI52257.1 Methylphosphotriester-DNA--protein-cysteine S-methyltransferase [uncultured Clostridium sp.]
MNNIIDFYKEQFDEKGFIPAPDNQSYCNIGSTWKFSDEIGGGYFWIYSVQDLYSIKIHDFFFHKDTIMEFSWPECLSISQYDSVSGEELSPYRRLEAGSIKSFIGGYKPYKVLIHKNIPVKSVGIEIMPAYYEGYLEKQYPDEYISPQKAFSSVGQTMNFPEMSKLLKQVKDYRGEGIAASLFYEGKVAEAVALTIEWNKRNLERREVERRLSAKDIEGLKTITLFLNDHYAQDITIEELTKIACMGATKLQSTFKQYNGCTITEYIQQRRMGQAEYLLAHTDFNIGQVAKTVGYSKASRFAELFRKSTGLLPGEFRKISQR